ncbi:MAG: radical SAM protein [Deltaproteobacteria bacterium]|nr:radical SAM protein [Deltaproteobacteria bacterium]
MTSTYNMVKILKKKRSIDGSVKYLYYFEDGSLAEAIRFKMGQQESICISTQIGCPIGCRFCAVSNYQFVRNLQSDEIIGEVELVLNDTPHLNRFDEVAFQGTGEPLYNLVHVARAAEVLCEKGLATYCSVATSGNHVNFSKLKKTMLQKVYLSLHATEDKTRARLIPKVPQASIDHLLKIARKHVQQTGIKVTINYILLKNINDTEGDLTRLIDMLKPDFFTVQLSVLSPVKTSNKIKLVPSRRFHYFKSKLEGCGFTVTILNFRGTDIDGGCGQMVSRHRCA